MLLCAARFWLRTAFLGLFLVAAAEGQGNDQPEVATRYGRLRGKRASVTGTDRTVNVFLGIPFAKPPVGDLRFSPPQPAEPWSHVRESSYAPMCLQDSKWLELLKTIIKGNHPNITMSEDCLYLNVFTPDLEAKLPVMVWIHGGALTMGDASMYDGSVLSAYESVVVVTIQYRLGLHGFFSTGSKEAPGNWGLLDQVAALRWVQENIQSFGGDPHAVTIFGESAGGWSVSAHVLSPLSKGLFHRAISQSGVALLPGLFTRNPETIAKKVANISSCEMSPSEMVSCLRSKTEEELNIVNIKILSETGILPVVTDGEFLPKEPEELLAQKEFNAVPYMVGMNNHEYGWGIFQALNFSDVTEGMDRETITATLQQIPPYVMSFSLESLPIILEEYLGETEDRVQLRDLFQDLMGDALFVIPSLQVARSHRDTGAPVYFYEYQHPPTTFKDKRPGFVKADHGDELIFVFGVPFLKSDIVILDAVTEEEKDLSRTIMKYWGNFARNGNPNGQGLVEWPRYAQKEEYLELNLEQKKAEQLKKHKVAFWLKTLPGKLKGRTEEPQKRVEL